MKKDASSSNSMFKNKSPLRVIAFITLWAFLFNIFAQDIARAAGTPIGLTRVSSIRAGSAGLSPQKFNLPYNLGTVTDSWEAADESRPPVVIHIQDAHCNYAAQHKIAEIVEYLNKQYGITQVNLEGGAKDYDLSVFDGIKEVKKKQRAADHFVREGLVNGAEYFAINNPGKIDLWGIENTDLYIKNLKAYRNSLQYKNEADTCLESLNIILNAQKHVTFSKELLELDTCHNSYETGDIQLNDYLDFMFEKTKQKSVHVDNLPSLNLLKQSTEREKLIDFKLATKQRDHLVDALSKILSDREMEEFVLKIVAFKAGSIPQAEFYSYLLGKANSVYLDVEAYPELKKYINYISDFEKIKLSDAFKELGILETKIKEALYENNKQRELDLLSKNLAVMKNLFAATLTRDDYSYYRANESSFNMHKYTSFMKHNPSLRANEAISLLDRYRKDMVKFYEYSFKRDEKFIQNLRYESRGKRDDGEGAILITGGFHAENLSALFKKHNISYISIAPKFENDNGCQNSYFNILSGEKSLNIKNALPSALDAALAIPDPLNPAMQRAVVGAGIAPIPTLDPSSTQAAPETRKSEPLSDSQIQRRNRIIDVFEAQRQILSAVPLVSEVQKILPGTIGGGDAYNLRKRDEKWAIDLNKRIHVMMGDEWGRPEESPVKRGLVEGPAEALVNKINNTGSGWTTFWSNAYGPYLNGVVWKDGSGNVYFTPLTEEDYFRHENLGSASSPTQTAPAQGEGEEAEAHFTNNAFGFIKFLYWFSIPITFLHEFFHAIAVLIIGGTITDFQLAPTEKTTYGQNIYEMLFNAPEGLSEHKVQIEKSIFIRPYVNWGKRYRINDLGRSIRASWDNLFVASVGPLGSLLAIALLNVGWISSLIFTGSLSWLFYVGPSTIAGIGSALLLVYSCYGIMATIADLAPKSFLLSRSNAADMGHESDFEKIWDSIGDILSGRGTLVVDRTSSARLNFYITSDEISKIFSSIRNSLRYVMGWVANILHIAPRVIIDIGEVEIDESGACSIVYIPKNKDLKFVIKDAMDIDFPAYELARRNLGSLAARTTFVGNVTFIMNGKKHRFKRAMIQEKVTPLRILADQANFDSAKGTGLLGGLFGLERELYRRGMHNIDHKILENYGLNADGNIVIFDFSHISDDKTEFYLKNEQTVHLLTANTFALLTRFGSDVSKYYASQEVLVEEFDDLWATRTDLREEIPGVEEFESLMAEQSPDKTPTQAAPARGENNGHSLDSLIRYFMGASNTDLDEIAKVDTIFEKDKVVVELGCGTASSAKRVCQRNPDLGYLAIDPFPLTADDQRDDVTITTVHGYYEIARDWESRQLDAQHAQLENLAILRGTIKALYDMPDASVDYIVCNNPSLALTMQILDDLEMIRRKLKPSGQLILKPWVSLWDYNPTVLPWESLWGSSPVTFPDLETAKQRLTSLKTLHRKLLAEDLNVPAEMAGFGLMFERNTTFFGVDFVRTSQYEGAKLSVVWTKPVEEGPAQTAPARGETRKHFYKETRGLEKLLLSPAIFIHEIFGHAFRAVVSPYFNLASISFFPKTYISTDEVDPFEDLTLDEQLEFVKEDIAISNAGWKSNFIFAGLLTASFVTVSAVVLVTGNISLIALPESIILMILGAYLNIANLIVGLQTRSIFSIDGRNRFVREGLLAELTYAKEQEMRTRPHAARSKEHAFGLFRPDEPSVDKVTEAAKLTGTNESMRSLRPAFNGKNSLSANEFEAHIQKLCKEMNIVYTHYKAGGLSLIRNNIALVLTSLSSGNFLRFLFYVLSLIGMQTRPMTLSSLNDNDEVNIITTEKTAVIPAFFTLVLCAILFSLDTTNFFLLAYAAILIPALLTNIIQVTLFKEIAFRHELMHAYIYILLSDLIQKKAIKMSMYDAQALLGFDDGLDMFSRNRITSEMFDNLEHRILSKLMPGQARSTERRHYFGMANRGEPSEMQPIIDEFSKTRPAKKRSDQFKDRTILHITGYLHKKEGIHTYLIKLAKLLASRNTNLTQVIMHSSDTETNVQVARVGNSRVIFVPFRPAEFNKRFRSLSEITTIGKIDLIVDHVIPLYGIASSKFAIQTDTPHISFVHFTPDFNDNNGGKKIFGAFNQIFIRDGNNLIATAGPLASQMLQETFHANTHVMGPMANTDKFQPLGLLEKRKPQNIRKQLGLGKDDALLLVPASFTRNKGQNDIIAAVSGLVKKGLPLKIKIVFMGELFNQYKGFYEDLKKYVSAHGLGETIIFKQPVSQNELRLWYAASDAVVMASEKEGFSATPIEAGLMKCPIIAYGISGIAESVVNGKTGFLVPWSDTGALRVTRLGQAIEHFLALPREQRQKVGDQARSHVLANLHPDKMIKKHERLYLATMQGAATDRAINRFVHSRPQPSAGTTPISKPDTPSQSAGIQSVLRSNEEAGYYILSELLKKGYYGRNASERKDKLRAMMRNNEAYVGTGGITFIRIKGLLKNTNQFAHIGLGHTYGKTVVYIDKDISNNKERRRRAAGHEYNEIEFLKAAFSEELGVDIKDLAGLNIRGWMRKNIDKAVTISRYCHYKANKSGNGFEFDMDVLAEEMGVSAVPCGMEELKPQIKDLLSIGLRAPPLSMEDVIGIFEEEWNNPKDEVRHLMESTIRHSIFVAQVAYLIASELGIPEKDIQNLVMAALLHDVGKGVPEVANKILTDETFSEYRRKGVRIMHVQESLRILNRRRNYLRRKGISIPRKVIDAVGDHHKAMNAPKSDIAHILTIADNLLGRIDARRPHKKNGRDFIKILEKSVKEFKEEQVRLRRKRGTCNDALGLIIKLLEQGDPRLVGIMHDVALPIDLEEWLPTETPNIAAEPSHLKTGRAKKKIVRLMLIGLGAIFGAKEIFFPQQAFAATDHLTQTALQQAGNFPWGWVVAGLIFAAAFINILNFHISNKTTQADVSSYLLSGALLVMGIATAFAATPILSIAATLFIGLSIYEFWKKLEVGILQKNEVLPPQFKKITNGDKISIGDYDLYLSHKKGKEAHLRHLREEKIRINEGQTRLTRSLVDSGNRDISHLHASVTEYPDGSIYLQDLDSTSGTSVNGVKLLENAVRIHRGDKVHLGGRNGVVMVLFKDAQGYYFHYIKEVMIYPLTEGLNRIGRNRDESDVHLLGKQISRQHAEIWVTKSYKEIGISDMRSENGTYANGVPVLVKTKKYRRTGLAKVIPLVGKYFALVQVLLHERFHELADFRRGHMEIAKDKDNVVLGGRYVSADKRGFKHPAFVSIAAPAGMLILFALSSYVGFSSVHTLISGPSLFIASYSMLKLLLILPIGIIAGYDTYKNLTSKDKLSDLKQFKAQFIPILQYIISGKRITSPAVFEVHQNGKQDKTFDILLQSSNQKLKNGLHEEAYGSISEWINNVRAALQKNLFFVLRSRGEANMLLRILEQLRVNGYIQNKTEEFLLLLCLRVNLSSFSIWAMIQQDNLDQAESVVKDHILVCKQSSKYSADAQKKKLQNLYNLLSFIMARKIEKEFAEIGNEYNSFIENFRKEEREMCRFADLLTDIVTHLSFEMQNYTALAEFNNPGRPAQLDVKINAVFRKLRSSYGHKDDHLIQAVRLLSRLANENPGLTDRFRTSLGGYSAVRTFYMLPKYPYRIHGTSNPHPSARRKTFVDLACGINVVSTFQNLNRSRQHVFVDTDPFAVGHLQMAAEMMDVSTHVKILCEDAFATKFKAGSVGTVRMSNLGPYLRLDYSDHDHLQNVLDYLSIGGQIIVECRPQADSRKRNESMVNAIRNTFIARGEKFSEVFGHFEGNAFIANSSGYKSGSSYEYRDVYIFTKLNSEDKNAVPGQGPGGTSRIDMTLAKLQEAKRLHESKKVDEDDLRSIYLEIITLTEEIIGELQQIAAENAEPGNKTLDAVQTQAAQSSLSEAKNFLDSTRTEYNKWWQVQLSEYAYSGTTYPERAVPSQSVVRALASNGDVVVEVGVGQDDAVTFRELQYALGSGIKARAIEFNNGYIPQDFRSEIANDNILALQPGGKAVEFIKTAKVVRICNLVGDYFRRPDRERLLHTLSVHMREGSYLIIANTSMDWDEEGCLYQKLNGELELKYFLSSHTDEGRFASARLFGLMAALPATSPFAVIPEGLWPKWQEKDHFTPIENVPERFMPSSFAMRVTNYLHPKQAAKILSLGAGDFRDELCFAERGYEVTAIEQEENNNAAIDHSNITPVWGDIREVLPGLQTQFDVIYARLSLHYLNRPDLEKVFAEISRLLAPGGYLCIVVKSQKDHQYLQPVETGVAEDRDTWLLTHYDEEYEENRKRQFFDSIRLHHYLGRAGINARFVHYRETEGWRTKATDKTMVCEHPSSLIELVAIKDAETTPGQGPGGTSPIDMTLAKAEKAQALFQQDRPVNALPLMLEAVDVLRRVTESDNGEDGTLGNQIQAKAARALPQVLALHGTMQDAFDSKWQGVLDEEIDWGENPSYTYSRRNWDIATVVRELSASGDTVLDVGVGDSNAITFRELAKYLGDNVSTRAIEFNSNNIPKDLNGVIVQGNIFGIREDSPAETLIREAKVIKISNLIERYCEKPQKKMLLYHMDRLMDNGAFLILSEQRPRKGTNGADIEQAYMYQKVDDELILVNFIYSERFTEDLYPRQPEAEQIGRMLMVPAYMAADHIPSDLWPPWQETSGPTSVSELLAGNLYTSAKELIPEMLSLLRKSSPTYAVEPSACPGDVSPVFAYLRKTEKTLDRQGHDVHARTYLADDNWESNLESLLVGDGQPSGILDQFYSDLVESGNLRTRLVIRILSGVESKREVIRTFIINQLARRGQTPANAEQIFENHVRLLDISADNTDHLNSVLDLFVDLTAMELDRYGKEGQYEGRPPYDLTVRFMQLLDLSIENIDQLKVLSDGIDPEAPLYAVVLINMFRGKVLRITPHNWESLRKLKDQWDEMLAAA